jgi:hypothetical protein
MSPDDKLDEKLAEANRVLSQCEVRRIDPVSELQKAIERHDVQEKAKEADKR